EALELSRCVVTVGKLRSRDAKCAGRRVTREIISVVQWEKGGAAVLWRALRIIQDSAHAVVTENLTSRRSPSRACRRFSAHCVGEGYTACRRFVVVDGYC